MKDIELRFEDGTIVFNTITEELKASFPAIKWDTRTKEFKAPALDYRNISIYIYKSSTMNLVDSAKAFNKIDTTLVKKIIPRSYQKEAVDKWLANGGRGVVVLPTGAGKTVAAVMAIAATQRPVLVHVPTKDLLHQWYSVLKDFFGVEIGLIGDGYYDIKHITVSTYDSAYIHMPRIGNRFGLIVFDECHHLPSAQMQQIAIGSIAPYRLGLTATPERSDGGEFLLNSLIGEVVHKVDIKELEGINLAPYEIRTLEIELSEEEREIYTANREVYVSFLRGVGIDLRDLGAWSQFIKMAYQSQEGREAMKAYRVQKQIALGSSGKEKKVFELIKEHSSERIIVFTEDNATAYRIGHEFSLPVLTHHTKTKEREAFLSAFRSGKYNVLVTSKVLNEGVDVPEASIAIVVSGSATIREHVQRLGRILRSAPNKRAILYELISLNTAEKYVNERRKQHSAYQRPTKVY